MYHLELMLSSGTTYYHLGLHVVIWDAILSSGTNIIICDKMLSSGANVIMVSSGANIIILCYHVMLLSGMITHPFIIFPENLTHSRQNSYGCMVTGSYSIKRWTTHLKKEVLSIFLILNLYSIETSLTSCIDYGNYDNDAVQCIVWRLFFFVSLMLILCCRPMMLTDGWDHPSRQSARHAGRLVQWSS